MTKTKDGYIKVCGEITKEDHKTIIEHNKTTDRPIIIARVIQAALHEQAEKIRDKGVQTTL